jgi:Putative viral replication protein.
MNNPNSQSRKWLFTIQKPSQCGLSSEYVHSVLQGLMTVDYYCFCREIAKTGNEHMHIFIYSHSPIRFSTAKKRFPMSHLDKALGTCAENRAYLLKEGKWAKTEKAETSISGSFEEWGTIPTEGKETSPQKSKLIELIQSGMTTSEIILSNPNYAFKTNDINLLRETLLSDKYSRVNRELTVTYIFGNTGVGKSHYIFEHHSPLDICRITSYGNKLNPTKFDSYHGQSTLVFEEYHSQINLPEMLNILDVYPLQLPARYNDRIACYNTVYIVSNLPLNAQYADYQAYDSATWNAFVRRITSIKEFKRNGVSTIIIDHNKKEYLL